MTGYRTAKPLLRALLGLALFVPSVLAPLPAAAQVPPQVSFSPNPVLPGGSLTVTVAGFSCNQSVTIDLTSRADPRQIITLGSIPVCKLQTQVFNLSPSVPVDLYRVRATDEHAVVAVGDSLLTVSARGGIISGTATCKSDGIDLPLRGALVELFSGSDLVARTTSDSNAQYTFLGLGANATYLVEFTQFADGFNTPVRIACGAQVTTNSDGGGKTSPPDLCPSPDDQDHGSWDNAYTLTNTVAIHGGVCRPGQSFWAKLAINPGSTVFVSVLGGGPKTRVQLFKDLRKEADLLLAKLADPTLNVRQLTASLPGATGTGLNSSDWDSEPWGSNDWDSEPWGSNDWDSEPWGSNDWDSEPCPQTACGDVGSQDGPVYSAAEQRALLARSKHGQITRNTWDNTDDYYVRVFNQDASFDPTQQLTLSVNAGPVCGTGNFSKTTTPPAVLGNPASLILVNTARITGNNGLPVKDPTNFAAFQTALTTFAAQPTVNGLVIDLANDGNLATEYTQWDKQPSCVPAANIVSESIHDVIAQYRSQPGSALKYVTLVGGHKALPYRLIPDYAEIAQEKRYNPGVLDQSQSAASLGSDYVMTDNYYISFTPISHLESEINLPEADLGVGRLVETSDDITSNLQAFIDNNGLLKPTNALASGYTFVKDLASFEATQFTNSGLTTETGTKDSAHPQGLLISDNWTMPDLKAKIFAPAARFDIVALNWHAATNVAVAADYDTPNPTVLTTADIDKLTPDQRFRNALILSIGCHLGYNLPNPDVIGQAQGVPVTDPRDFTQLFAGKGAMVVANTGYGYGDTDFMGYSERLLGTVAQELQYTDYGAAVPVGLALTRAKRNYVDGAVTLTGVDKKSVEQLSFYGPPMWSVAVPTRQTRPTVAPLGITPVTRGSGLSSGDVTPPYTLTETVLGDGNDRFFSADGGTVANNRGKETLPYRAVQPFKGFDITNSAGTARGVAMLGADYQDLPGYFAKINLPVTEEPGSAGAAKSRGFTPFMPFGLNELLGQSLAVTPFQWSTPDINSPVARRYLDSSLRLRTYYSSSIGAAALAGPATIGNVAVTSNGSLVHVDATIRAATVADISDVLLTYTAVGTNSFHNDATGRGSWASCNLVPGAVGSPGTTASCLNARERRTFTNSPSSFERHYSADIETAGTAASPADLRLLVQAVTGTGLVSVAANNGQYYQVVQSPTISTPKHSTVLTLTPPSTPSAYDHSATFSATLRDLTTQLPANGQIIFTVGSQQVAAQTTNGTATATLTIMGFPGAYQVKAAFVETPTLLGATASHDYAIVKKATSLAFGITPFLVKLTDADGHLMRDQTVFFNVTGSAVPQTLSAQTGRDGVAQLRGLNVPAGTYTVTAFFLGAIPFDTGGLANLSDERYSASSVSTTLVADKAGPTCSITAVGIDPGTLRRFISITFQDKGSGLASVSATRLTNAVLSIPPYVAGTQAPLIVTAYRVNQALGTVVSLEGVDAAGNVTNCDPALLEVGGRGEARTATASDILPTERYVTVYNGRPGINRLDIVVNKRTFEIDGLKPGQVRTIDIAKGLHKGKNVVTVKVEGNPNGSALVLISDTAPTPAQTRRNPNDPQGGNNNNNNNNSSNEGENEQP